MIVSVCVVYLRLDKFKKPDRVQVRYFFGEVFSGVLVHRLGREALEKHFDILDLYTLARADNVGGNVIIAFLITNEKNDENSRGSQ
jgi:hypothetical protein